MNPALTHTLSIAALAFVLVAASGCDVRERRVPNALAIAGLAAAFALSAAPGGIGFTRAAAGTVAGLAAFLPLHLLRAMGAGDVKLMAAVGAFIGWPGALAAAIYALAAGGALATAAALAPRAPGASLRKARIPFAPAIAAGAGVQIVIAGLG